MKNKFLGMFLAAGLFMCVESIRADCTIYDREDCDYTPRGWKEIDIPALENEDPNYKFIENVAQYKNADWSQVVGRKRSVTVEQAKKIADDNSEITYFFFVKGYSMVLETGSEEARLFSYGDAVFFSGTPWWGSAPDLADGYVKVSR